MVSKYVKAIVLVILTVLFVIFFKNQVLEFDFSNFAHQEIEADRSVEIVSTKRQPWHRIFIEADSKMEDFSVTEYLQVAQKTLRSFTISGRKIELRNPKVGIFRIAIGKVVELENPELILYENDKPLSRISALMGIFDPATKDISFSNKVVMRTANGKTLFSDKLRWRNEDRTIEANGHCILFLTEDKVESDRIKADIGLENFSTD